MEAFFRTHRYLVEHTNAPVRRTLMDEIDWSDRMIGIKGPIFWISYSKYSKSCIPVQGSARTTEPSWQCSLGLAAPSQAGTLVVKVVISLHCRAPSIHACMYKVDSES